MSRARLSGVTLPLFSIRTERDWGIGQVTDLPACAAWVERAGQRLLQVLPPYELAEGETSPYGARTAFGLDPVYIGVESIEDLDPAAIDRALGDEGRRELARLRALPHVDYLAARALKAKVLHAAFERFRANEWDKGTPRAQMLRAFVQREATWCDDLCLYVAIRGSHNGWGWEMWPDGEKSHDARTLADASRRLFPAVLEHAYLQWIAHVQWDRARGEMRGMGVELMGDVPFVVGAESADVWSHASQFRRDLSLGAPPDAFSPDGQDWGLPPYDWASMEVDDLAWHRARTRHAARLYDRFRLDHVVGYFRQWVRPKKTNGAAPPPGRFDPEGEDAQRARGERLLRVLLEEAAPAKVIAEDLGVIPPFVRETMQRLGLPGYKVIPWERDERAYRDPRAFPRVSVASWSTHDTPPITAWWSELPEHDRRDLSRVAHVPDGANDELRTKALMKTLLESGADLTLTLAPEVLGETTRINTPGTVGGANWTYRLPAPIEELVRDPKVNARLDALRELVVASGRA
jgi:4-alpha-glucanotransferase